MLPMEVIEEKVDGLYPNPSVTQPANLVSVASSDSQQPDVRPQVPMHGFTVPKTLTLGPHLVAPTPSRSSSPTSLEVYFLERK